MNPGKGWSQDSQLFMVAKHAALSDVGNTYEVYSVQRASNNEDHVAVIAASSKILVTALAALSSSTMSFIP